MTDCARGGRPSASRRPVWASNRRHDELGSVGRRESRWLAGRREEAWSLLTLIQYSDQFRAQLSRLLGVQTGLPTAHPENCPSVQFRARLDPILRIARESILPSTGHCRSNEGSRGINMSPHSRPDRVTCSFIIVVCPVSFDASIYYLSFGWIVVLSWPFPQ